MTNELWRLDATDVADGIRSGRFSAREVVASCVDRMRALNPRLNAVIDDRGDEALVAADAADAAVKRGDVLGPLHGVPITIKTNIDVTGQPTPNGLPALADNIATGDSAVVANVKRAGAIIIGRTNAPELSMRFTTYNPLNGLTVNPWNSDASVGGSSGGAGCATAAGFGPLHHGNDIAGSLRAPAMCNGVTTIKPTQGRMPAFNPSATSERGVLAQLMSSQGFIGRSVADVRLGTRVMAEHDPRDPWWVPAPWDGPALPTPITVAVTTNAHGYPAHAGVMELVDRTAGFLSDAGYRVIEVEPPPISEPAATWFTAGITELKLTLDATVRKHGSTELQDVFDAYYDMGTILDLAGYRQEFSERTRMMREWSVFLHDQPLVLTPYFMRPTFAWNEDAKGPAAVRDLFDSAIYSYGLNLLGLPAGFVPIDLVDDLPSGIQIVGRRYREDVVLDAMAVVEARAGRLVDRLWARECSG
jgi:amidase